MSEPSNPSPRLASAMLHMYPAWRQAVPDSLAGLYRVARACAGMPSMQTQMRDYGTFQTGAQVLAVGHVLRAKQQDPRFRAALRGGGR